MECSTQRDSSQVATKGDKAGGRGAPIDRLECRRKHWERAIALVMSVAMEMKEAHPLGGGAHFSGGSGVPRSFSTM